MCTVTFIPSSYNDFILTSNRDEAPTRNTIQPQEYEVGGVDLLFPKDELAGGTWIGLSQKNRLICLLNGGFTAHERQSAYRMSRGVIVTDLLTADDAIAGMDSYDFNEIEPFTIILVDWSTDLKIVELVWDGRNKHITEKPVAPQIWSSSLLYTEGVKKEREKWFSSFLLESIRPATTEILNFHRTAGNGEPANNLIMDRGFVKTKSITQIVKLDAQLSMRYEDLQQNIITQNSL